MLTDRELVDYTIKFSDDPEKIRLATVMERVTGAIIDDLVDAGMHETFCTFRSEWGGEYHPGRYITLLEDEIRIRDEEIQKLQDELEEREALTIAGLIEELRQEVRAEQYKVKQSRDQQHRAEVERDDAKSKLSMWNKLNGIGV